VAVMLQSLQEHQTSLSWFDRSLTLCGELHGKECLNVASISFQMAQAHVLAQDPISAVPRMRDAYTIFAKRLGPDDKSTKETEFLLKHFTATAVVAAKQAKGKKSPEIGNGGGNGSVSTSVAVETEVDGLASRGLQSIDELVKYIGDVSSKVDKAGKKKRGGKR
jgi:protein TIF31